MWDVRGSIWDVYRNIYRRLRYSVYGVYIRRLRLDQVVYSDVHLRRQQIPFRGRRYKITEKRIIIQSKALIYNILNGSNTKLYGFESFFVIFDLQKSPFSLHFCHWGFTWGFIWGFISKRNVLKGDSLGDSKSIKFQRIWGG